MATITKTTSKPYKMELEVKRFYIPGTIIHDICKGCKSTIEQDLGQDYLSYPVLSSPEKITLYCNECGTENVIEIIVNVSVELVNA